MNKIYKYYYLFILVTFLIGCRKTEFAEVPEPAYIRVFNCLERNVTLENKDAPQPFLTMLVDPVFDEQGVPVSAEVVGDFLDTRDLWARPYPDAANTTIFQKEYPGAAKIVAAPFLNGYDLSSWAQVRSGNRRFAFYSRPMNTVPFFSLDKGLRINKLLDTTVSLKREEVYTMHVMEKDFIKRENMLYVRNETFVKQPLSDSLVYVNFYNLSSDGYFENGPVRTNGSKSYKLVDTTNVFLTLRRAPESATGVNSNQVVPGFNAKPFGQMIRSLEPKVNKYYSFPLFSDTSANRIYPGLSVQLFEFLKPGYVIGTSAPIGNQNPDHTYLGLRIGPGLGSSGLDHLIGITADVRSGLIITERSGIYNPRYFATVNTVEYINAKMYVTTIQRKFDAPIY